MMNHMEMNDRLRSENLSTAGRYRRNAGSIVDHQECQVTSSCRNDNEMIRMQLRRLWKTLLSKNEKSRFDVTKLCRTKTVKFLGEHIFSPCERVRDLALDLLCGTIPRLEDKTDSLLQPLTSKVIQCFSENSSRDVETKALHFLRNYARHTKSVRGFMDLFFRSGVESNVDAIKVNCLYGINVIFDQDIGDELYSRLVLTVSSFLKGDSHPLVFLACYRVLKRIHEQIEDERFYKLLDLINEEANEIYINFLNFEENDPYLNSDLEDLANLISEYQRKRRKMRLNQAFGIVEPIFLKRIIATKGCERALMVNNFEIAIKRGSWTEYDLESHVQDLIKLIAAFLIDPNRLIHISGLEILKEIVQRMGFHLAPYLGNIIEILLVPLRSSNVKIKSKTEKLLHNLMKNIHPMTVIWELLEERDAIHREAALLFLFDVLKCFSYYQLDLACLFVTIGQWMEDQNPGIRSASRDCIRLLLEIMESSPVPAVKTQAIGILLRNCHWQADTLRSVGISVGDSEESLEDFDSASEMSHDSTGQSTMETLNSYQSVTRNSATNHLQSQMPGNHQLNENNKSTHSFTTACNDSFLSCDGNMFSDIYLSKLTLKSTKTDKQSRVTVFVPVDSRGNLQSAVSHGTEEPSVASTTFLTDTTYGHPYMGVPRHNSTPRKKWNVTPPDGQAAIFVASETTDPSAMDTFESGHDTLLCQKATRRSLKKEASTPYWIQKNSKDHAFQYADAREWSGDYSEDQYFENCEKNAKGDADVATAKSIRKRTKANEGLQSDGDQKPTSSTGCYVEPLDPKKFNFNILQVSTPQTMETIEEIDEKTKNVVKIEITEVLSSCVSTPRNPEMTKKSNKSASVDQINTINQKKRRQRTKFTEVRSPASSTCSSVNNTKRDSVTKTSKKSISNKDAGKISAAKATSLPFVANNVKAPKTKDKSVSARPNKNKKVSINSIEETHRLEHKVVSVIRDDEVLDITTPGNYQELEDTALSIKSESDINQQFLEDIDFDSEYEEDIVNSFREVDNKMTVEEELVPDLEISGYLDNTMTVEDDLIPDCEISEDLENTMTVDDETVPDQYVSASANSKLNDSTQNESGFDSSDSEIENYSHLSTVDEENSKDSSPCKNDKDIRRAVMAETHKKVDTKKKIKGNKAEEAGKLKLKSVLKKMTRSTGPSNGTSKKKSELHVSSERAPKLLGGNFLSTDNKADSIDLENITAKTVDDEITNSEIPAKIKKKAGKYSKKPNVNVYSKMLPDAHGSLEDAIPWNRGKELPRTPVNIQGNTKMSVLSRAKGGKKATTAESKTNAIQENKKQSEKKKATEVKRIRSTTWKKPSPCIPKGEEGDEIPERAAVENTSEGEFAGCQWRRDLEYAVKGGTCVWAQKFEITVEKMQAFQNAEVAENEMKKSLEDITGKSWKAKEEAMGVMIRLAKHHPEMVYDHIPKIIVSLCNEVKNFRQSVAGKAVLSLGYMYEYLGKKLESKLRLAVGALLARSGNRTLAAYFRMVIRSLFKIMNSSTPQKVALAFIQEGGKHPNKASRETAAQFLALLTFNLGPSNSLSSPLLAGPMIKCAAQFVSDCSALTRHCGKRMFQVLMSNPNFEKLKEHHLDINTAQNLTRVLEQIETKGVSEEFLPIKIIK